MKYYAIAYGHTMRFERATSESQAAKLAFGMVDTRRMTVMVCSNPKYMSGKHKAGLYEALKTRHLEKTGSVLS